MTKLTKKQTEELRDGLPYGAFTQIAKEKKISVSLVSAIFSNDRIDNYGVIERAIEIAMEKIEEEKKEKKNISKYFRNYKQKKKAS